MVHFLTQNVVSRQYIVHALSVTGAMCNPKIAGHCYGPCGSEKKKKDSILFKPFRVVIV